MKIPAWVNANAPAILSGAAVAGVVATAVLAVQAVVPAGIERLTAIEAKENKDEPLTKVEIVKAVWPCYIPAVMCGTATIACILGAHRIGLRRQVALLGAYTMADTAFREYKHEVLEQVGKIKERKIHDGVAAKQVDNHPVQDAQVIITSGGDQLCYESLTGRYFKSDAEKIRSAENEINRRILTDMSASLNELLDLFELEATILGDRVGFNIDNTVDLIFTSHLASNGQPALCIGYKELPREDYGKF
jgi:hypothetical protein